MNFIKILFLILVTSFIYTQDVNASSLAVKLSGKILLDVERDGEAWYVNPGDNKRYFLGRPQDAFSLMRELGLGIKEIDFQKLVKEGMPADLAGDLNLAKKLSGKIILQVEKNGEAWYVNPDDLRIYFLGRPIDAFRVMRQLSLGISRENLAMIHKPGLSEELDEFSKYEYITISATGGDFKADVITIDLDNPNLEIITDTANLLDCDLRCPAKTMGDFILENKAFAGINGSYFDTGAAKKNYYFAPVWNTNEKILINSDQLKYWTTGPVVAFDTENNFYYFKDSRDFGSVENFEKISGSKLQAAISNKPRLVENGMNQLVVWQVDSKQENAKAMRNALAYREDANGGKGELLLIIVHNSTLIDLAEALKSLEVDIALNLDGGYSSALWYNDEYMVQPGRDIPNAIVFRDNRK